MGLTNKHLQQYKNAYTKLKYPKSVEVVLSIFDVVDNHIKELSVRNQQLLDENFKLKEQNIKLEKNVINDEIEKELKQFGEENEIFVEKRIEHPVDEQFSTKSTTKTQ
jgi:hypothetical protein